MCVAVEGRFLNGRDLGELRATAERASATGVDVVFLTDGPLGDAIVLASAVGTWVPGILLGVRVAMGDVPQRHPTVLAREMTTFDLVSGARAVLTLMAPFTEATVETVSLCRAMWSAGIAVSDGPTYPVRGAINRPLPERVGGPPIALDLTGGTIPDADLLTLCDLVLVPAGAPRPAALPSGVDVCEIRDE